MIISLQGGKINGFSCVKRFDQLVLISVPLVTASRLHSQRALKYNFNVMVARMAKS